MLACPACNASVPTRSVYAGVPVACTACGTRLVLDEGGQRVESLIGWAFGIAVIAGGILAGLGWVPIWLAAGVAVAVAGGGVAIRPLWLSRAGRLTRF